jgi:uncharacterized protein
VHHALGRARRDPQRALMIATLLAAALVGAATLNGGVALAQATPPPVRTGLDNVPVHVALRGRDLVGDYYAPADGARHPAIVVLGGSEGGIPTGTAQLFAGQGYAALALGYFGVDPLPKLLDFIPVETVTRGVDWLAARPEVDPARIGIEGASKGAELALVAAAREPRIRAVAVMSPSAYVWFSLSFGNGPERSSWTVLGAPLPYVPSDRAADDAIGRIYESGGTIAFRDVYDASLAAAPATVVARATIPVEAIAAPLLCIAGDDDHEWNSVDACAKIAARRREAHRDGGDVVATEPGAGHAFPFGGHGVPGVVPAGRVSIRLGGSEAANAHAGADAWARTLAFFARTLSGSR